MVKYVTNEQLAEKLDTIHTLLQEGYLKKDDADNQYLKRREAGWLAGALTLIFTGIASFAQLFSNFKH